MADDLAFRSRPLPRFGDVVRRRDHEGLGVIYGVSPDSTIMIAFEDECIHTGLQNLEFIGSIYWLEGLKEITAKAAEVIQLPDSNTRELEQGR
jgi:hypothetical protein